MKTVMVVDDEEDICHVVRQILEKNGYNVVVAKTGKECLRKIREKKPDLVLLDLMMPGLDGWEVLGEIQQDASLKSVPVTMFTVKPLTPEILRKKEVEGLVNYIVKPFSKEGLVQSISQTLDSLSKVKVAKKKLKGIDKGLAEEYDYVSHLLILHKNFLSLFENIFNQRKGDGSLDDIQSFLDVIRSESILIDLYVKRKEALEGLMKGKG